MIHQKISQTAEERLANLAIGAMKMARSQATSPNGSASFTNADGTRTVLGTQNTSGSTMATHVGDTTPPGVPTGITAWSGDGSVHVSWDGTLTGGIPADFDHVTLYARTGTDAAITLGTLTAAGSVTSSAVVTGTTYDVTATAEDDACATDGTAAHNVSAECTAISVTVTDVAGNTDQHFWADTDGAHVSSTGDHDTSGFHQLMTSVRNAFMRGTTELMTISESLIELGKNSPAAIIKFCAGSGEIGSMASQLHMSGTKGAYLARQADIDNGRDYGVGLVDDSGSAEALIEAEKYLVAGITLTSEQMRTAIQPVVLYNGGAALSYDTAPGDGTNGTVTLSETAANFKELTIKFKKKDTTSANVNVNNSVTVFPVEGEIIVCGVQFQATSTIMQISTKNIHITGSSLVVDSYGIVNMSNGEPPLVYMAENSIYIVRVEGRR